MSSTVTETFNHSIDSWWKSHANYWVPISIDLTKSSNIRIQEDASRITSFPYCGNYLTINPNLVEFKIRIIHPGRPYSDLGKKMKILETYGGDIPFFLGGTNEEASAQREKLFNIYNRVKTPIVTELAKCDKLKEPIYTIIFDYLEAPLHHLLFNAVQRTGMILLTGKNTKLIEERLEKQQLIIQMQFWNNLPFNIKIQSGYDEHLSLRLNNIAPAPYSWRSSKRFDENHWQTSDSYYLCWFCHFTRFSIELGKSSSALEKNDLEAIMEPFITEEITSLENLKFLPPPVLKPLETPIAFSPAPPLTIWDKLYLLFRQLWNQISSLFCLYSDLKQP